MKRATAFCLAVFLVLLQGWPSVGATVLDTKAVQEVPERPYERVLAQKGNWYAEQVNFEKGAELVVAFQGDYKANVEGSVGEKPQNTLQFTLGENNILRGIYLPYTQKVLDVVKVTLKDGGGNLYGPYALTESMANEIVERSVEQSIPAQGVVSEPANYVFTATSEIVLPKGKYEMTINYPQALAKSGEVGVGAYLIKGVNQDGWERYKAKTKELNAANGNAVASPDVVGSSVFVPDSLKDYKYMPMERAPQKKKALFTLKEYSMIGSVVVNTYNEGKGAPPGTLTIMDDKNTVIAGFAANGKTLGGISNGAWTIVPNLVLPPGKYVIGVSNPEMMNYDKFGNPEFFVTLEDPPVEPYDFTGVYKIKFDSYKTSTRMGPVSSPSSSFSLTDFDLTILDKSGQLELVGKYKDMPFSQPCEIVERTTDKIVAKASFAADLSNLPAKAKITAEVTVTLTKKGNKPPKFALVGEGTYAREASKTKGADFNTYDLKGSGSLHTVDLPPFVMTALGKANGVGNVPGPDNAAQAAAGLLFPPLVGLVLHVLQELMKKKEEEEKPPIKKYTKEWYRQQNPNMSDESIAWAMLADAGGGGGSDGGGSSDSSDSSGADSGSGDGSDSGGTSEGDSGGETGSGDSGDSSDEGGSGDNGSSGDDGSSDGSDDDESSGDSESDSEDSGEGDSNDGSDEDSNEDDEDGSDDSDDDSEDDEDDNEEDETEGDDDGDEQSTGEETGKTDGTQQPDGTSEEDEEEPVQPVEPETMTLQTDWTGRTTEYVKDPESGEWINPETGGVLDLETYYRDVQPNFDKTKEFVEGQRDKLEKGDTEFDKELRRQAAERQAAQEKQVYMDKLADKYGTHDEKKLQEIISENKVRDQKNSEEWNKIGDRFGQAEAAASVVGIVADNAVDGLANVTGPAGRTIRAVYKVTKSVAGNMAEEGPSVSSFAGGVIKGGADAATDFIDHAGVKAVTTIAGETLGNAATGGWDGAKEGLVDGVSKVVQGAITDKLGGKGFGNDVSSMTLSNGNVRVAVKSGENWVGKTLSANSASKFISGKNMKQVGQTLVKGVGGFADEYGVKPTITEPIKEGWK